MTLTVLKLGGSAITNKDQPETVDHEALVGAVGAIAESLDAEDQLVLVHGGGSFGHHHAAEHGVSSTTGSHDAAGIVTIHRAMGDLNDVVLDRLHDENVAAVPVRPLSAAVRSDTGVTVSTAQVEAMLKEGFVPVTHGDVTVHPGKGATICSGDELVVAIASALDADRVGLCSTVPGVLDEEGDVVPEINAYDEVADILGESEATDVTGGMAAKVRRLLGLDAPASIFALDALDTFLDTGTAGTVVDGGD